ncbi:MAG TPA: maleylacetoacetate isomerase [Usitatibacter sp.]|nr:maleylacetoacetate isomerase [Usitatibacter sp.]
MKVYVNAWSNAPLRVRIAIALKGIAVEEVRVDLGLDEQHAEAFRRLNPQQMIPVLVDGEHVITQSLAIIEYLEEISPAFPLLPADPWGRARVRAMAMVLACEAQPLLNLRVRQYLDGALGLADHQCADWMRHWMLLGMQEVESMLVANAVPGAFAHGDRPTLADCCLVPQVLMAQRFGIGLAGFPRVLTVFSAAMRIPQVAQAVGSTRSTPARQALPAASAGSAAR